MRPFLPHEAYPANWPSRRVLVWTWSIAFVFCILMAALFQFVFLPYIAPSWYAGHGLMVGGDWLSYHAEATQLYDKIAANGWSEWVLRYRGHGMSGLLGALYAITLPEPWVYIPVAAGLQASAFLVLFLILLRFIGLWRLALIAALPFLIFPTTLLWTVQPLKDGLSITGFLLVLYAWFMVFDLLRERDFPALRLVRVFFSIAIGLALVWVAREYLVLLFQTLCGTLSAVTLWIVVRLVVKRRMHVSTALLFVSILVLSSLFPTLLPDSRLAESLHVDRLAEVSVAAETRQGTAPQRKFNWHPEPWVPDSVDGLLATLVKQRISSVNSSTGEGSLIDPNAQLESARAVLKYLPRAIQIALFAPFPNQWFTRGATTPSTLMRWVSSLEMFFSYVMMPFVLLGLAWNRRKPELWILLVFCGTALVVHPLFIANVGTLVRLRYPYFMTIICLGFGVLLSVIANGSRRFRGVVIR